MTDYFWLLLLNFEFFFAADVTFGANFSMIDLKRGVTCLGVFFPNPISCSSIYLLSCSVCPIYGLSSCVLVSICVFYISFSLGCWTKMKVFLMWSRMMNHQIPWMYLSMNLSRASFLFENRKSSKINKNIKCMIK